MPDSAKVIIESMLCNKPPAERLHGFSKVLDVERFEFWRLFGSGIDGIEKLRAGILIDAPWKPTKGVIYALPQDEIGNKPEEEKEIRKIKVTQEDDIEFEQFCDEYSHKQDIVKVLEYYDDKGRFNETMFERKKTIKQRILCCMCLYDDTATI